MVDELERRVLKVRDPRDHDRTLGERLGQVEAAARNVLRTWYINATYFTDHGENHARGVIESLGRLLPKDMYPGWKSTKALHPY
ncbi:MAG: hypothetical protein MUP62_00610, partial [Dehalococcoidia bacterium]|nr:hypothetical protein [Dehalococcoidia bacterium]